jgi:iron complex outermembrane receptor protein
MSSPKLSWLAAGAYAQGLFSLNAASSADPHGAETPQPWPPSWKGAKERIMVRVCRLSFLSLFALCAGLTGAVFAQEAPGAADSYRDWGEAEELVVTASRTREDALSVPAFVTVITPEEIARSGAASVVDVLETVPGVRFTDGIAGPGSEAVSMRGFGANSFGRVLVLLDGKRLNNPDMQGINWNAIPLAAIERIEVLDGGASGAYGNNAVGGVINIITKKAGERRTMLEVAGGSFLFNKASLSHFEPASWGGFSLSAEHTGTAGYRDRQGAQVTNLTGGADIDFSDTARLSVSASFADLFYQLPSGLTKAQFEDDPTQATNRADEISERDLGGGVSLQFFPSDALEITVPFSYMGKFAQNNTASMSKFMDKNVHGVEARPQVTAHVAVAGIPLRFSGGLDFYYANLDNTIYGDETRDTKTVHIIVNEINVAPYLTTRIDVLPVLSLSGGVRYDTVSFDVATTPKTVDESKKYDALVWDAGLVFRPLAYLKLYAKSGSLFRYPFTDEFASIYGTQYDSFNADMKPEKGFNAEAGLGLQLGKLVDFNANFYYLTLADELYLNADGSNDNMKDETRRIGGNIGVKSSPLSFLEISGGADLVNAVILDDDEHEIPLVPAFTLYASLSVKFPFGLNISPTFEYRGTSYQGGDLANAQDEIDGYFLLGVSARYVFDQDKRRLALQCTIKNLLDTRHTSNVYWNAWSGSAYYPGDGRSVNVSLQYQF